MILFQIRGLVPPVLAQIHIVQTFDTQPDPANGASSSGVAQNTVDLPTIPINLCKPANEAWSEDTDHPRPGCPVSLQDFEEGDIVYVLKGSMGTDDLARFPPKEVYCISADALENISRNNPDWAGRFLEPLRRRSGRFSLDDYDRRVVTGPIAFGEAGS